MTLPGTIWQKTAAKMNGDSTDGFTDPQKLALDVLNEYFQDLYQGIEGSSYPVNSILALSQQLSSKVTSSKKAECFNFVAAGFELGNLTLDWDVPLSPVYFSINREENYATCNKFQPTNNADDIVNAIAKDLETGLLDNNIVRCGQILVSAILFGGLMNRKLLQPFMVSLQNRHYYQSGKVFWVEMNIQPTDATKHDKPLTHRLVPDHMTRLLIYRLLQGAEASGHKTEMLDPWICASTFLKQLNLPEASQPSSLKDLLNIAFSRHIRLLPHSVLGYARGDLPATSLPIESWLRCLTGRAIPVTRPIPQDQDKRPLRVRRIANNEKCNAARQLELMSVLLKKVRRPKTGKITLKQGKGILKKFRKEFKIELSPTFQLLIYWSERLLEKRTTQLERRNLSAIKVSSLYRYLSGIGADLLASSGKQNILSIDPGDLEIIYEETAERKPKEVFKLRQFHTFLSAYYNLPNLEWTEMIKNGGSAISCVSANIIDQKVYDLFLQSLGWEETHDRWQTLRIISVILMFRCGLRPSETRAIRIIDIQGITRYEILVRKTNLNDTKSKAGVRRIPISDELTPDELIYLLKFLEIRKAEDHLFGGGLFLAHPTQKVGMLPDDKLFNPARRILKIITKDETIVLYHLRHSFLTWLNTQAQLRHNDIYQLFKETFAVPDRDISYLLSSTLKNEPWNRKLQYVQSMLIGHSTPLTTNRHYNHLLDITLGYHLVHPENCIPLNKTLMMTLTGSERSQAFEHLKTHADQHPLQIAIDAVANKYTDLLQNQLELQSSKMKPQKQSPEYKKLPSFDEAILQMNRINNEYAGKLSAKDWAMAAQVYESVRDFDGRKIKSAIKSITYVQENYDKRWGGISFSSATKVNEFIKFIGNCRISKKQILIVHHARYRQNIHEKSRIMNKWSEDIKIDKKQFLSGEEAYKGVRNNGIVTIKISNNAIKKNELRSERMSKGIVHIFKYISSIIN